MTARYSRFGVRIPDADVHAAEDGTVVRAVSDPYPTVGGTRCLHDRGDWLCWLPTGHDGECLPLPRKNWEPTK